MTKNVNVEEILKNKELTYDGKPITDEQFEKLNEVLGKINKEREEKAKQAKG
jgi:hypothetical protein